MTIKEKKVMAEAIEICRMVVKMGSETINCGVCGGEPECDDDCPFPRAKALIEQVDGGKEVGR